MAVRRRKRRGLDEYREWWAFLFLVALQTAGLVLIVNEVAWREDARAHVIGLLGSMTLASTQAPLRQRAERLREQVARTSARRTRSPTGSGGE